MKAATLLRVASAISLLFAAGHSMGGLKQWSPMGPNPVLNAMSSTHFQTMGVSRSYLDFYLGFGWSLSVAGLLQAVLLWQLAGLARAGVVAIRPMIAALALASLASGAVAWFFIFPMAAIFCLAISVPLAMALFAAD